MCDLSPATGPSGAAHQRGDTQLSGSGVPSGTRICRRPPWKAGASGTPGRRLLCHLPRAGVLFSVPRQCAGGACDPGTGFRSTIAGDPGGAESAVESCRPDVPPASWATSSQGCRCLRDLSYPGKLPDLPCGFPCQRHGHSGCGPGSWEGSPNQAQAAGVSWAGLLKEPCCSGLGATTDLRRLPR